MQAHAPVKPVLVFVSSRRQTRLTALDLIAYAAADERPQQFVHMPAHELEQALSLVHVCSSPAALMVLQSHPPNSNVAEGGAL